MRSFGCTRPVSSAGRVRPGRHKRTCPRIAPTCRRSPARPRCAGTVGVMSDDRSRCPVFRPLGRGVRSDGRPTTRRLHRAITPARDRRTGACRSGRVGPVESALCRGSGRRSVVAHDAFVGNVLVFPPSQHGGIVQPLMQHRQIRRRHRAERDARHECSVAPVRDCRPANTECPRHTTRWLARSTPLIGKSKSSDPRPRRRWSAASWTEPMRC